MSTALQEIGRERVAGEFGWPRAPTRDLAYLRSGKKRSGTNGTMGLGNNNLTNFDC